ncbi:MAG TPA: DUF1552 domain-containing protein [Vicinamibacterales bacterium]
MFVTKKALPRRTFLQAMGATVALPFLDAMVPALSAQRLKPTPRFGFVYIANGVIQDQWVPSTVGAGFDLPSILQPFAGVKDHVSVLSGLSHLQADTFGDGTGDHPRASAVWLTGVHAYDRAQPGVEVRLATTVDQMIANAVGRTSRIPSIELAVDFPTQGACDSGDCFYINTVSWRNATTPNPTESHPRVVFERLFGDGGSAEARQARRRSQGSILDSLRAEIGRVTASLGAGDKMKLGEYFESVREVEQRIQNSESQPLDIELSERPLGIPERFDEHTKLMFDLQALAFRADVTRVFSMIMSRELSTKTFAHIGVPEQHHAVSHHRNDPDLISRKARIDVHQAQMMAYFLEKLQATPDGDGTLLDHSLILYGGGMGDGNLHRHSDLPCLMAGKLGGAVKPGRHVRYPVDTPMSNLLLTVLDAAGVPTEKLGDSTGRLPLEPLTIA